MGSPTASTLRRVLSRAPRWLAAGLLSVVVGQLPAFAVDRAFLEWGGAHEGNLIRLGAQWDHEKRWFEGGRWHLEAALEVAAGSWRPELGDDRSFEIGVTPVFRLAPNRPPSVRVLPFLEAGIGAHLLSDTHFGGLNLSTSFQFGSHIGAGLFLGRDRRLSLIYRFQHLSNARIKQPNPGIEFHLLQIGYRFDTSR